eukprot:NODE_7959_length_725_cov_293.114618_g7343_i0.p1 GENE.NODE_7959_length_725_cov_293.114618_g7343_i0~~NODE_7959_length_725_cov_293.114618_g7343_i0.p1  ORF type:complete len:194 (-),score=31.97 NODE_7959_length_725_cov_293.114618_g7343_i0:77-658(-)
MGIDLDGLNHREKKKKLPRTENPYNRVLIKIYKFLSRRAPCKFNKIVLHRLAQSQQYQRPVSTSRIARAMKDRTDSIAVVVGPVTNDTRLLTLPKLTVVALKFTKGAHTKIVSAGGKCLTFDQLALTAPTGRKCCLLRGRRNNTTVAKQRGAPGVPGSHSRPKLGNRKNSGIRGRGPERGRGRRKSKQWKVRK